MREKEAFSLGQRVTLAALTQDLPALLHRLRAAEPVSWVPVLQAWLVTSRPLAVAVMRDAGTFTVDHPGFSTAQVVGPSMLSLDGAAHAAHRGPFEKPFRRGAVQRRFRQPVVDYCRHLWATLSSQGEIELRREYAGKVAAYTMITALGLSDVPLADVLHWYDDIVDAVTRITAGEPLSAAGQAAYAALTHHLRPVLRQDPATSLLAAASQAGGDLSEDEILSNAAVLLFGGIETTEGMIANALYHLLTHPEWLPVLAAEPALLPLALEESLRLEPAAAVVDRYAVRDVVLGGALIREGDLVRVSLTGANRDPAVFPEPDRFNPRRENLRSHVTFAQGPHVCLGLHLARLEVQAAVGEIMPALSRLQLVDPAAASPQGLVFRKPAALRVVVG